jgi:hypothetical protein
MVNLIKSVHKISSETKKSIRKHITIYGGQYPLNYSTSVETLYHAARHTAIIRVYKFCKLIFVIIV